MTKKLAVPPISPAAGAAIQTAAATPRPFVPTNWQDAFADLSERMIRIVGHQQGKIQALTAELTDARGVAAAAGRAHAELTQRIDALVNFNTKLTETIVKLTERIGDVHDSITKTTDGLKLVDEAVGAHSQNITKLSKRIDDTVEQIDTVVSVVNAHAQTLTDQREALATVTGFVKDHGEALATVTGLTRDHGEALAMTRTVIAEYGDALTDLRGVVSAAGAAAAVQVERVDDLGTLAQSLRSDLQSAVHALDAETVARAAAINDLSETASSEDAALAARVDAIDLRTIATERAADAVVERTGAVENRVIELQRLAMENVERVEVDGVRIERVEETVIGFVAKTKAVAVEIEAIDKAVKEGTASAADMLRRVNIMLGETPAAMMIDKDGELVRVTRSGEVAKLGKVTAEARDGANAADIVAVRLDGDRLVFTRSDRTEFGCSAAALIRTDPPVPPAPDEPVVGYLSKDPTVRAVQVKDMIAMRGEKKSYKVVAEKYQISPRQVVRLIKGASDEKSADA